MERIEWTPQLSVDVPLIDAQHKGLIERIRSLAEAVEEYQGASQVIKTLDFLTDYAVYHFATEEQYMDANAYPGASFHKGQHEEFRRTLAGLAEDFREEGASQDMAARIKTMLYDWFVSHIERVDKGFGAFLRQKGVNLPLP